MWVLGALLPPLGSSPAPEATVCHSAQEPACLWLQIPALLLANYGLRKNTYYKYNKINFSKYKIHVQSDNYMK